MAKLTRLNLLTLGALLLSWTTVALAPSIAPIIPWRELEGPLVPSVSTIPWTRDTDVMSSVPGLFMVLVTAAVAVVIVEIAKVSLQSGQRGVYGTLVGYQLILALDTIRVYAPDWWIWFTFFLGFRSKGPFLLPGIGFPWLALGALILALLHVAYTLRQTPRLA